MASKLRLITDLYGETLTQISKNPDDWMSFLECAAMNYKYPFNDQVLIYAQRPEAVACAKIEAWNKQVGRWVNRGAKGIALLTEDEDKVESGIKKIKEVIDSNKLLDGFDRDVFDALVDYIIIGGYENGKKDDCMIRFICKTQFDDTPREDLTKQKIIDNNDIMDYKCNSFINILDFYSNQQFFYFYVDENGKKRKKVINSVRVRVEVEK